MHSRQNCFTVSNGPVSERSHERRLHVAGQVLHSMWRTRCARTGPAHARSLPAPVAAQAEGACPAPFRVIACAWRPGDVWVAVYCGFSAAGFPNLVADACSVANAATHALREDKFSEFAEQDGDGLVSKRWTRHALHVVLVHSFHLPKKSTGNAAFSAMLKQQREQFASVQRDGATLAGQCALLVEAWHADELQFDICAAGALGGVVPVQSQGTAEQIARDITHGKRRQLQLCDLPRAKLDDAMVRYLGLRAGDVLRSERTDGTVHYRLVSK